MKKFVMGAACFCAVMLLCSCYAQEVNVGMAEDAQAV